MATNHAQKTSRVLLSSLINKGEFLAGEEEKRCKEEKEKQ